MNFFFFSRYLNFVKHVPLIFFFCFSAVDKSMMSYQSGDKCLSILGFTKLKNIPRHLFVGKGVLYIAAQKGDSVSMEASWP